MSLGQSLRRTYRSLFARIVFVYLVSMIALSTTTTLVAVDQFNQLGREWLQRNEIDMAHHLTRVLQDSLDDGVYAPSTLAAVEQVMTINPALSLYALDTDGTVVGAYGPDRCGLGRRIDRGAIDELLSDMPMLPVYADMPCRGDEGVFSVAPITYGPQQQSGYLMVQLEANTDVSMANIWQTSSISRTLLIAGCVALALTLAVGLALFAFLTRRFSRLTRTVQHFAEEITGSAVPSRSTTKSAGSGVPSTTWRPPSKPRSRRCTIPTASVGNSSPTCPTNSARR